MPSEARSTTAPTPLRLASFLLTAGGGLAAGLGALLPWAVLAYPGFGPSEVPGVDLWEGRVALACALAVLVAIPASRLVGRRPAWGALILAAGLLAGAMATAALAGGADRLAGPPARAIARELAR
ncbi:MAG TPA: hypothetical protein VNO17_05200, partial [Actinomycetota bacterium]|nr:hypothetical protein [Actinomycetota bacterium]